MVGLVIWLAHVGLELVIVQSQVVLIHRPKVPHHQLIEHLHLVEKLFQLDFSLLSGKRTNLFDVLVPQVVQFWLKLTIRVYNWTVFQVAPLDLRKGLLKVETFAAGEIEKGEGAVKAIAIAFDGSVAWELLWQNFKLVVEALIRVRADELGEQSDLRYVGLLQHTIYKLI